MKFQYLIDYPDPSVAPGFVFEKGWTAEHTEAEGQRRVDLGVCIPVDPNAYARRAQKVVMECAVPFNPMASMFTSVAVDITKNDNETVGTKKGK
jgi:hypothetical protein